MHTLMPSVSCIGFSITAEELATRAAWYIKANAVAGWTNLGSTITALRNTPELRWASPLDIKNAVEKAFLETFGAKETAKAKAKVAFISTPLTSSRLILVFVNRNRKRRRRRSPQNKRMPISQFPPLEARNPSSRRDSLVVSTNREKTLRSNPTSAKNT